MKDSIWTTQHIASASWYRWYCSPGLSSNMEGSTITDGGSSNRGENAKSENSTLFFFRREASELILAASGCGTVDCSEGGSFVSRWKEGFASLDTDDEEITEDPALSWSRYVIGKEDRVTLSPVLPDRPLVLIPRVGRKLPPGKRGTFTFQVPLHGSFSIGVGEGMVRLFEFPLRMLTSTWFGDLASGELCYGLSAPLLSSDGKEDRDDPGFLPDPLSAQIRLHLTNTSKILLDFSKICIHVEYLSLYRRGDYFLTNDIHVNFSGADQLSQLRFGKRAPKFQGASVEKIATPRIPPGANFLKRSFSFLKSLTDS